LAPARLPSAHSPHDCAGRYGCVPSSERVLPERDLLGLGLFCQAALKAANRGYTDIKLRERGTKKLERVQVDKPKDAPAWMPDKIWKHMVKKVGTETLEGL
jgi:hypothetical protein